MTLNEFIKKLKKLDEEGYDKLIVGSRQNKLGYIIPIKDVSIETDFEDEPVLVVIES